MTRRAPGNAAAVGSIGLFVEFPGRGRVLVRAVRGLSYDIAPGETIGLLGDCSGYGQER
jgi:ABC-type glutathione transport system ATPase component